MRYTAITINPSHIAHNVRIIKAKTRARLLAMVKASAYGHGLKFVVPALTDVDGFGVACMQEALQLVQFLPDNDSRPIVLIEGVFSQEEWHTACARQFMSVIHHPEQLAYALAHIPEPNSHSRTVWLKYNSGMNRLGFCPKSVQEAHKALLACGYRVILTSHFACADDKDHLQNAAQIQAFDTVYQTLKQQDPTVQGSLCNSAGIVHFAHAHYDWVRAGIALYGASPSTTYSAQALNLKPAMSFLAQIIAIHTLDIGESVGYGALWTATHKARIAIVSAGYGDGYPRVVQGAQCVVRGQLAPIVGRVAMDMLAIDISAIEAQIGDTVTLWGDGMPIDVVAQCANTISCELMCRLSARPMRMVHG